MNTKIKYTDEAISEMEIVPNFLPSPEELIFREEAKWTESATGEADLSSSSDTV